LLLSLLKDIFLLLKAMFKNHSLIANDSWFWIDALMTWVRLMEFSFPFSLMSLFVASFIERFFFLLLLKEFLRIITWVQICTLGFKMFVPGGLFMK
jgi:hypothetical protein